MIRLNFLSAVAGVAVFGALCVLFFEFVADDAFIVGRYALNAANGKGLVYNPGEYLSALTSPLHALLLTGIASFSTDPVAFYRLLAPLLPLLGAVMAYLIYRPTSIEVAIIAVFALASPFLALWSVGGLETPLLTAWLTMFAAFFFKMSRSDEIKTVDLFAIGVLAALAFLTRFDSILITLPLLLSLVFVAWNRWQLWAAGAVSALIASSWLIYAYITYGDILPTSAHIKLAVQGGGGIESLSSLLNVVIVSGALFALIFTWGHVKTGSRSALQTAIWRGAFISGVAFAVYSVTASGVHMMFGFRMFVPICFAVAMIIAAHTQHRVAAVVVSLAAIQAAVAVTILTVGMNVRVIENFGPFGQGAAELSRATPADYGQFMTNLRLDAEEIRQHWSEQGKDQTPAILLFTGGMGYRLMDFYVFEELVSYRKACPNRLGPMLEASSYIQSIDRLEANNTIQNGSSPAHVNQLVLLELTRDIGVRYRFSQNTKPYQLPSRINDPC